MTQKEMEAERERIMIRNALQMDALIESWKRSPEGRRRYVAYRRKIWDVRSPLSHSIFEDTGENEPDIRDFG